MKISTENSKPSEHQVLHAMDAEVAIAMLTRATEFQSHKNWKLFVRVHNPGTIGGSPCVPVTGLSAGIDWDSEKILLDTGVALTVLSQEDVDAIRQSAQKGQSWHAYQAYKKQDARIKELEAEVAQLRSSRLGGGD